MSQTRLSFTDDSLFKPSKKTKIIITNKLHKYAKHTDQVQVVRMYVLICFRGAQRVRDSEMKRIRFGSDECQKSVRENDCTLFSSFR